MLSEPWVVDFVAESNRIAGISRAPSAGEISAHRGFLAADRIHAGNLEMLVFHLQPGGVFRRQADAIGGEYQSPDRDSVTAVREALDGLIEAARLRLYGPWAVHLMYRELQPFTAANGRSGRALWLWQMLRGSDLERLQAARLGFLESWYQQSYVGADSEEASSQVLGRRVQPSTEAPPRQDQDY